MKVQIERLPAPLWLRSLIPIVSVVVTFVLTSGFVLAVGANPLQAVYYFLFDPLANPVRLIEVLVKATPLLMTGAAVAFAFAGGYWNIGVEDSFTWAQRQPLLSVYRCITYPHGSLCRSW